jgi:alkaline phosphatase D
MLKLDQTTSLRALVNTTAMAAVLAFVGMTFAAQNPSADETRVITRIGLGSCIRPELPNSALGAAAREKPDVFVFLGDNMYGDTHDMAVMARKWQELGANADFKQLREQGTTLLATWDDHDYGDNDMGNDYKPRAESQKLFLDFWGEPADSPRRTREGIYDAKTFGPAGQRVQFILLDTRYHRSPLVRRPRPEPTKDETGRTRAAPRGPWWEAGYPGDYLVNADEKTTILGEQQWAWLEEQLKKPADLRIIASSIQFVSEEHRFENWGNFPHERRRMVDLINRTNANGVVFVSGDRHWSEISILQPGRLMMTPGTFEQPSATVAPPDAQPRYPLIDLTASSLNRGSSIRREVNLHRVGGDPFSGWNYGLITIDWNTQPQGQPPREGQQPRPHTPKPRITLEIRDANQANVLTHRVALETLQPKPASNP